MPQQYQLLTTHQDVLELLDYLIGQGTQTDDTDTSVQSRKQNQNKCPKLGLPRNKFFK